MRLEDRTLHFIINFLLGVAWSILILSAVELFILYYETSFFTAMIMAIISTIPSLLFILFLEYLILSKERAYELKKQTKLLEKILEKNL